MRTLIVVSFFLPLFSIAQSTDSTFTSKGEKQTYVVKDKNKDGSAKNYTTVEYMPEYVGGEDKLGEFIRDNFKVPKIDKEKNIKGRVVVSFVVNQKGKVTNTVVRKSLSKSIDKEAVRVLKKLKFKPGYQDGKPVSVFYTIPLNVQY